ncbi:MAG: 2-oxo acid dehydrogenase subunit E2 [Bacteroidetes bacterium]|nr:2-oxo acid dehydrogenase subunit E2 [Bacteroidota bacterium]
MSVFQFLLPDIGEGTAEGEIVKWHVKEGDSVIEDQPMVEVMTDKATVLISSPKVGKILKLYGREGDVMPVHQPMVDIALDGETVFPSTPIESGSKTEPDPVIPEKPVQPSGSGDVLATPGTRKLARSLGVNLSLLSGSGKNGRITDEDVKAASGGVASKPAKPALPTVEPVADEEIPFTGIRRKIADRMVQSKFTAPHFTYMDEVDVTDLVAIRNRLKSEAEQEGIKLTYMAFILKALGLALAKHPILNSTLDTSKNVIRLKKSINIGIGMDTPTGLIVPVIRDVKNLSIYNIASVLQDLAARTKKGQVRPDELKEGSFTISNVGAIGGLMATPVINFPEVAIMAPGKIQQRPVVVDGELKVRWMMYHSWSCDHRIVDGADAVRCGNTFAEILSRPELLLIHLR